MPWPAHHAAHREMPALPMKLTAKVKRRTRRIWEAHAHAWPARLQEVLQDGAGAEDTRQLRTAGPGDGRRQLPAWASLEVRAPDTRAQHGPQLGKAEDSRDAEAMGPGLRVLQACVPLCVSCLGHHKVPHLGLPQQTLSHVLGAGRRGPRCGRLGTPKASAGLSSLRPPMGLCGAVS